jgi:hypothetical protein
MSNPSPNETYARAAAYLQTQARPLEAALYAYHFAGGPADAVLDALAAFQNPDGGFGRGLEPDIRLEASSVIATTVALQRLREVNAPESHPLVAGGCAFLRATYDATARNWPIIPASIDDAPHAPWWTLDGPLIDRALNPRAEILGYVWTYPAQFSGELRAELSEAVRATLAAYLAGDEAAMEMHDLLCCLRLDETPGLPGDLAATVRAALDRALPATVSADPDSWEGYGLPPLGIIKTPASPFAARFADVIPANTERLIAAQTADGSWGPAWSWGDGDGETGAAWEDARRAWCGVLTLDNLRTLRAFGRL